VGKGTFLELIIPNRHPALDRFVATFGGDSRDCHESRISHGQLILFCFSTIITDQTRNLRNDDLGFRLLFGFRNPHFKEEEIDWREG
jgi:hypothetical protein